MSYPQKLFYFGKVAHVQPILDNGEISFGGAATFTDKKLTRAQQDDELKRTFKPKNARVLYGESPANMHPLKNIIDVKFSLGISFPYFMKCFAMEFDEAHFSNFPGGICVEIADVPKFMTRLDDALKKQLPRWGALSAKVEYADFKRLPNNKPQQIDLLFLKDADVYANQGEYRIVLLPPDDSTDLPQRQSVFLGSLADIASIKHQILH